MTREFTRIEFEGDKVIIVSTFQKEKVHLIKGNTASKVNSYTDWKNLKHKDAVNTVIANFDEAVKRQLNHFVGSNRVLQAGD